MAKTYYYSGTETSSPPSDNYSGGGNCTNSYLQGYKYTTLSGVVINGLDVYIAGSSSAANIGAAICLGSSGTLAVDCGSQSIVFNAWNIFTLGTAYTLTGSDLIWFQCDQTWNENYSPNYNGEWQGPTNWPNFLTSPPGTPNTDGGKCYAIRLWATSGGGGTDHYQDAWANQIEGIPLGHYKREIIPY